MIRRRLVSILVAVAFAVAAGAQQHPNLEKGFHADKAYAIDGIEGINLFNGNLNLRVPIGITYNAGGGLQYAFQLTYAGNSWNYAYRERITRVYEGTESEYVDYLRQNWSEPDTNSNAGLGWRLSLGRLIHPELDADVVLDDPANATSANPLKWLYESPDGGVHAFHPHPHDPSVAETGDEVHLYTRDGSYLRYTRLTSGTTLTGHRLEFPNGLIREFLPDGSLQSIKDRFGNSVTVTIDGPGVPVPDAGPCTDSYTSWTVSDGHRTHYAYFARRDLDATTPKLQPYGTRLCQVNLAAFEGTRAIYKFHYVDQKISRQGIFTTLVADENLISPVVTVPLLTEIEQPDGSRYTALYDIGMSETGGLDSSDTEEPTALSYIPHGLNPGSFTGHVRELTLPTGGKYAWTYGTYAFPLAWIPAIKDKYPNFEERTYRDASAGVREKRHYVAADDVTPALWLYESTAISFENGARQAGSQTTLTDPAQNVAEHYFSACRGQCLSPYSADDYGLPFVKRPDMALEGMDLSSRTLIGEGVRTIYLKYENDGISPAPNAPTLDLNRRLQKRMTVYEDGSRTTEVFEDFDGLGHYRKVTTGDGTRTRETVTNYNPGFSLAELWPVDQAWITETFDATEVREGGETFRAEYCFEAATGFLERKRTLRSKTGARAVNDLLSVFTRNGNVEGEKYYGGDATPLPENFETCSAVEPDDPAFEITHTFSHGTRATSKYSGMTFPSLSHLIDVNTGFPKLSKDPEERETHYGFDSMGRLESIAPPGTAWTKYTYDLTGVHPSVRAAQYASDSDGTGTPLTESWFYYDGLGRMIQQKRRMLDGWSTSVSSYDGLGRAIRSYVPRFTDTSAFTSGTEDDGALKYTETTYDALGRATIIKEADGSNVVFHYAGPRETKRTVKVATKGSPADGEALATTEKYDGFGRLVGVVETSPSISTTYTYNGQDRLTQVESGEQTRTFGYDGAGLLGTESHPELSVPAQYTYNARGHAVTKKIGTIVDLTFTYDKAERLDTVLASGHVVKGLSYDDGETGALTSQTRINAFPDQTYSVTDAFAYDAATGRLASKTTNVTSKTPTGAVVSAETFQQTYQYDELSAPSVLKFPACLSGCAGLTLPDHDKILSYKDGLLTGIADVTTASGISYTPTGAVAKVVHADASGNAGVIDEFKQEEGLWRLAEIVVHSRQCAPIRSQPQDAPVLYGEPATFTIDVVPGAIVKWYEGLAGDDDTLLPQSPGHPNLTIPTVTETKFYWAAVSMPGGGCSVQSRAVAAIPCTPPAISMPTAGPDRTLVTRNTTITLIAAATGTELSYTWDISGPNVQETLRGLRHEYVVTDDVDITLTVTNACGTSQQLVARYDAVDEAQCSTSFTQGLDDLISVPSPNVPYKLQVALAPVAGALPNVSYHVQWFENDVERKYETLSSVPAISQYGITMRNADTFVRVRAWVTCDGIKSPEGEEVAYATVYGRCTVPPVSVSPASGTLSNGSLTLTASSVRPHLSYQWYRGSTGDTRQPVFGATGAVFAATSAPATYWVRGTASCGSYADSPTIPVSGGSCQPVRIVVQPKSSEIAAGSRASIVFFATSSPAPDQIQWYKSSAPSPCSGSGDCHDLEGGNAATHSPAPLRTTDYWAVVGNGCDTTTTMPARVHVTSCADINITSQPQDLGLPPGTSAELRIAANAGAALLYQWYEGESGDTARPIEGATGPALPVTSQNARYWVRLSFHDENRCAVDSRTVVVASCAPLVAVAGNYISDFPGQPQVLNVDVEGDPSRLSYAWYLGEEVDETKRLWSETDQLLVMPQYTSRFLVRVTRSCPGGDLTTERVMQVSVCPQDLPNPLANGIAHTNVTYVVRNAQAALSFDGSLITPDVEWRARPYGTTGDGTVIGTGASVMTPPITQKMEFWGRFRSGECTRDTEFSVVEMCTGLDAEWSPGSVGKVSEGSTHSITVHAVTTQTALTYQIYEGTHSGDVAGSTLIHTSSPTYSARFDKTRTFWARVTGDQGCYADTAVHTVRVCVPDIRTSPQSVILDKSVTPSVPLTVVASPTGASLQYQWYSQNGATATLISGATSATYNASPDVDTSYWVRVTGCDVPRDSATAVVTVCKAPGIAQQPSSVTSTKGVLVSLTVVATGTAPKYQWYERAADGTSTLIAGETTSTLNRYPQVTTDYWVKVTGTCGSIDSAVAKVSIPPEIVSQPVAGKITSGTTRDLTVVASGTQLRYEWYAHNGTAWALISNATAATYRPPPITANTSFICRVYSGAAPKPTQLVTFEVCLPRAFTFSGPGISGVGHHFYVTDPQPGETYLWYIGDTGDTRNPYSNGVSTTVYPTQTTNYWLRTRRAECDADGPTVTVPICIPRIGAQPVGKTITSTERHTLSVAATGSGPLTYQWYTGVSGDMSAPISGATANVYTPPASSVTQSYWARVSSPVAAGCSVTHVNSAAATISICHPPSISTHPSPVIVATSTSSTTLLVTASGSVTSYQWYEGAAGDVSRPVGPNDRAFPVVPGATKSYWVRVNGSCGFADSRTVLVSVSPRIDTAPVDAGVCRLGDSVRLSMSATGATSYQWCRLPSGSTTWETLSETGPMLTVPVPTTPTYFIGSAVSGDAIATTNQVAVTLLDRPPLTSISRRREYGTTFRLTAKVTMTETSSYAYRWYEGALGNTSKIIGYSDYVFVTPTSPVTYWVRVTDDDTGCYSDMADSF